MSTENAIEKVKILIKSGADINFEPCAPATTPLVTAIQLPLEMYSFEESFNNAIDEEIESSQETESCLGGAIPKPCDALTPEDKQAIKESIHETYETARRNLVPYMMEIIEILTDNGANINASDLNKKTPLHRAALTPQNITLEPLKFLIERGANVNAQDINGNTPLFIAYSCNNISAVNLLINAGADVTVKVFKNLNAEDIRDSVDVFVKAIDEAQIIMFPGGFSAGDEPEGSAKFFATAFRNAKMTEAVGKLLSERDGLALGICNGFQALIKLGLVPYGQIQAQSADSPTLTYNTINRHISKMVYTKVVTNKSPWLQQAKLGATYCNPASHGEGRFVAPKEWLDKLFANGQVATQYVNEAGEPTMDEEWNVNGSYMAIEGITSPDGRVLGKMAHSERRGEAVAMNIYGEQDMKIFESGVAYFK